MTYDPAANKINYVERYVPNPDPALKKVLGWSKFEYDLKGNLHVAENSERKRVVIVYDSRDRIKTMVDQDKRQISFEYDESSKPVKITDSTLGFVTVEYANSGEIKNVKSPAGRKVQTKVMATYNGLIAIIQPTAVPLTF